MPGQSAHIGVVARLEYNDRGDGCKMRDTTSQGIVYTLKEIFATHGIPDIVISDNGPQFSAASFRQFTILYGFVHVTSFPRYPQSNGKAERAVHTVNGLLKRNEDIHIALMTYRATPLQNGLSPAEMLMGRRLRTLLPVLPSLLKPIGRNDDDLQKKESAYRNDQTRNFNARHRARDLPTLQPGETVWIRDQNHRLRLPVNVN